MNASDLFALLPVAAVLLAPDGRVLLASEPYARLTGTAGVDSPAGPTLRRHPGGPAVCLTEREMTPAVLETDAGVLPVLASVRVLDGGSRLVVLHTGPAGHVDPLAHLLARSALVARTQAAVDLGGGTVAVLLVDVDGLAAINAAFGHPAGDEVLRAVAGTVVQAADRHTVARWSGDELAVLLTGVEPDAARGLARRLANALRQVVDVPGCADLPVSACVGLALGASGTADALLQAAEAATRQAKRAGRGQVHVLTHDSPGQGRQRALGTALTDALRDGGLRTHYQPIVDLLTGHVRGFEALVRWPHPQLGMLGPGAFLPVAEALDLLDAVDEHVLHEACASARAWADAGHPATISVNVSPPHLTAPGFAAAVRQTLDRTRLTPGALVLEVTETAVVADIGRARRVLQDLRALGVRIALDDFGTGYSSLLQLRELPFDTVKIDRAFVAGLPDNPYDTAICASVLSLTERLGKRSVAEGVETLEQAGTVAGLGCTLGQGFLWSPAVDGERALDLLHRQPWLRSAPTAG